MQYVLLGRGSSVTAGAPGRRPTPPPSAAPIGTAKPMPMKVPASVGLASATTMPATCPRSLISGPPELPGLTAASNWMSPEMSLGARAGQDPVQAGDDTAGGGRGQAERVADRHHVVADREAAAEHRRHHRLRQLRRGQRGDVLLGVRAGDHGRRLGAVGVGDLDRVGAVDHVQRGEDGPVRVDDHAGAGRRRGLASYRDPPRTAAAGRLDQHHRGQQRLVDLGHAQRPLRGGGRGRRHRAGGRLRGRRRGRAPPR